MLRETSEGPATRPFDWFFAPTLVSDNRFAHQSRFRLPPEFPLASFARQELLATWKWRVTASVTVRAGVRVAPKHPRQIVSAIYCRAKRGAVTVRKGGAGDCEEERCG